MIDGYIDNVSRDRVSGWAADAAEPGRALDVVVKVNGIERGSVRADRLRLDLQSLGTHGEGLHGFQFAFEPPLSDVEDHEVIVAAGDEQIVLCHGRALVQMDDILDNGVRTPPVMYGPEPNQHPRGDISTLARYVIHVGPHKTGSKYLQTGFARLRGALYEIGAFYPMRLAERETKAHVELVRRLVAGDPELRDEFAALNASAHKTILLSSEDLVDLPNEALHYLKDLLDGQTASFVFYCRRWAELMPSAWQEVVKQGSSLGLPEFLAHHLINPVGSTLANYDQALGRLSEVFGRNSLHLVSYSNLVSSRMDLLAHFLETFVNWSRAESAEAQRENVSLDIHDVELIRALNAMEIAQHGRSSFDLCARYLAARPMLDLGMLREVMDRHINTIEINEASSGLRMVHEVIFERYGERLVHPRSGLNLFPLRAVNVPFIGQDYLLDGSVLPAIMEVYQMVSEAAG